MELVQPDGTYLCAGSVGSEYWPEERRGEAEALGLKIREHPPGAGMISVGGYKLFTARSTDRGKSWIRREWVVPGMAQVSGNRPPTFTEDGAIPVPRLHDRHAGRPLQLRLALYGRRRHVAAAIQWERTCCRCT